jgi:hypothetical protein
MQARNPSGPDTGGRRDDPIVNDDEQTIRSFEAGDDSRNAQFLNSVLP